jgi:hypothetical protein
VLANRQTAPLRYVLCATGDLGLCRAQDWPNRDAAEVIELPTNEYGYDFLHALETAGQEMERRTRRKNNRLRRRVVGDFPPKQRHSQDFCDEITELDIFADSTLELQAA